MNSITVAKFGGTSMADASAMKKSAHIVAQNPKIKLVVVSATSGTSNALIEIYNQFCAANHTKAKEILESIRAKHIRIANDLGCVSTANDSNEDWQEFIEILNEMDRNVAELAQTIEQKNSRSHAHCLTSEKLCAQKLDHLLSFGEKLSSYLFVIALRAEKCPAEFFDVQKILITDDSFGKAEPNLSKIAQRTREILTPALNTGKIQVTQGFVGTTESGETTTLGRGGSDFTAALLAESLGADALEIWTDVPGIMTMDPNIIKNAKVIPQMSFAMAAELTNFGAKVLHPATLLPAMRQNIKTFVGSTFHPELGGTWIYPEFKTTPPIQAIALRKKQILITINSLRMLNAHGFLAKVFEILAANKLSIDLVTTSEVSVALTIDQNSLGSSGEGIGKYSQMFDEIKKFCDVIIEEGLTLIALIGTDLIKIPKLTARTFSAIEEFNIRLICHGASPHNLCFLVKEDDAVDVARKLHSEFIERSI